MMSKKTTPPPDMASSGDSPFSYGGGTPAYGLSDVFMAMMANNSPEEAAVSLCLATMGGLSG
jgi:hypothetical protein